MVFSSRHDGMGFGQSFVVRADVGSKGEVFARGVVTHTKGDHEDLDFGFRWHQMVHNIVGAAYTLSGSGAMANFD